MTKPKEKNEDQGSCLLAIFLYGVGIGCFILTILNWIFHFGISSSILTGWAWTTELGIAFILIAILQSHLIFTKN